MAEAQILVVEDERIVGEDIERSLKGMGFHVSDIVSSGEAALASARRTSPALVLMDIMLKGEMDGIEAARRIRMECDIPVVYLTAYADETVLSRAKLTGPFGYIIKPFEDRELRTNIELALYKHRAERELQASRNWLSTTLRSIGDAVMATDTDGRVTLMNPVAESLTGWNLEEASGRPLEEVFRIINEDSRKEEESPASKVLRQGVVVGLANHTLLIARDGTEIVIDDSGAPIRDEKGNLMGVVLVFRDVREKRRIEEALKARERYYRSLLSSLHEDILVIDREYRIQDANSALLRTTGRRQEEVVGRKCFEILHGSAEPCHRSGEVCLLDNVFQTGKPRNSVHRHKNADGTERWVDVLLSPLKDEGGKVTHVIEAVRDVTDLKTLEQEKDRILNLSQDLICVAGRDGYFKYVNPAWQGMLGYTEEELLSRPLLDFIHPDDHARNDEEVGRLASGKTSIDFENRYLCRDGTVRTINWTATPLPEKEVWYCIGRDVTDRRKMEEERGKLEKQLRQAQKMEALGTLAGGIAHDFNNILAVVNGYAELALLDAGEDAELRSRLEEVLHAGLRGRDLANQILTFSRQAELECRPLDLERVLRETLRFLRASIPTTIEIRQSVDVKAGMIMGNPTQVHQVIMNLCTNAAHAMGEKGGVLSVHLQGVDLAAEALKGGTGLSPGPYLMLIVSDTGHGMDKEVMDRIFEPFFTTKGPGKGTGMGLSLVHGIVQRMGGAVSVSSEPGEGSRFEVLLPRLTKVRREEPAAPEPAVSGTACILLVDDEIGIVKINQEMLGRAGYEVIGRTSSVEALEAFRANPKRFDLVITDMTMPQMTGLELSRKLLEIRADIPIIICTGFSEALDPDTTKERGIRDALMKPVLANDMKAAIARILKSDRQERPDS